MGTILSFIRSSAPPFAYRDKVRYSWFLFEVIKLALTSFGGPIVHLSMFSEVFVQKRKFLTQNELLELFGLCQILPGPTSTQTITAIGFRIGGPRLAFLTLIVWITPAVALMTIAAFMVDRLPAHFISLRFIQPMAVAIVALAAFRLGEKVIKKTSSVVLLGIAGAVSYFYQEPFVAPLLLLGGGMLTAIKFKEKQIEIREEPFKIDWANFILFAAIFIVAALLGHFTDSRVLRLFENFYRNGSLIFGGGQVLISLMFKEFVQFKQYLSAEEFLSGYALAQGIPGPVFAFSSYIGVLAMRPLGGWWQLLGSIVAAAGIFLPGTLLIFFIIRFWSSLKKFRLVRASLEGIQAASCGLVVSAAFELFQPLEVNQLNVLIIAGSFGFLYFTRIPTYLLIAIGLSAGVLFP